jgi:hypothetical protein
MYKIRTISTVLCVLLDDLRGLWHQLEFAKSGMVGMRKNRRRTAEGFLNFPRLLPLLTNINRIAAIKRKGIEITNFCLQPLAILPCLLFADGILSPNFHHTQPIGTFAQWVSVLFGHFPLAFQYPLRFCQRLSNNLLVFSSSFPTPF